MRIATFNILHGRTVGDDLVDLDRLRACIRELDPDVLALQEVDLDQDRSGRADLTAVAAEAMGAVAHRFVAAIAGTPGATWIAATGEEQPGTAAYGIALLSRYPASSWQVVRLPKIATRFPMYVPGPNRVGSSTKNREPRSLPSWRRRLGRCRWRTRICPSFQGGIAVSCADSPRICNCCRGLACCWATSTSPRRPPRECRACVPWRARRRFRPTHPSVNSTTSSPIIRAGGVVAVSLRPRRCPTIARWSSTSSSGSHR